MQEIIVHVTRPEDDTEDEDGNLLHPNGYGDLVVWMIEGLPEGYTLKISEK